MSLNGSSTTPRATARELFMLTTLLSQARDEKGSERFSIGNLRLNEVHDSIF